MKSTLLLTLALTAAPVAVADPVTLDTFRELQRPAPTVALQYGPSRAQGVDVFVPEGAGPHPVAILVHGGCWRDLPGAGREQLRHLGRALADRGIATWSIGYRRADEPGGGYPGTFLDVGAGIDLLRTQASTYRLDPHRTVIVGHSAGGHLALWASARDAIPASSPLHANDPLVPGATISLAGIGDLREFARFVPVLCGPGVIERLAPTRLGDAVFAQISPADMQAPAHEVVMMSGTLDRLVPPYVAHDYAQAMQAKHARRIERVDIADAGHFDLVTPGTQAWDIVLARIARALAAQAP